MNYRCFFGLMVFAAILFVGKPMPATAQGQSTETVPYTFKSRDTLLGLAERYLVNQAAADTVQRINGIKDATKIREGTVIRVPTSLLKSTAIGAKIVAFSGTVSIIGKKGGVTPIIGAAVLEGQTLSTGAPGFLTLSIAGGSNVSIPSRSRVKIVRLRKYLLTGGSDIDLFVEQGRAETAAAPVKDSNSRFRMRTPTAVSAVRGTVFRIGYDGPSSSSLTEVVEGAVAVDGGTSTEPTLIPMGFGAALPRTGVLLQEKLLPAPKVTNSDNTHAADIVKFNLSSVEGAIGYRTQVARDAGFLEIFGETVSANPVATFENVPDGSLFVRSTAISESNLEGVADIFGFRRRLLKISSEEASNPFSGLFQIKWVPHEAGTTVYRFQLFDEKNQHIPIIDELGLQTSGINLTNLPSGTYSWRVGVRQTSQEGLIETWSTQQKFIIGD